MGPPLTVIAHVTAAPEFANLILRHEIEGAEAGARHVIIASPGADLDTLERDGYSVVRIPMARKLAPISDIVTVARLVRAFLRIKPDLVHTYTPKAGLLGQMAGAVAAVQRRVHGCRGLLYHPRLQRWQRWLFLATDWITCRLANRVLFVSQSDLLRLVKVGACPPDKAVWTGNGVDLRLFPDERSESERRGFRSELGFGPDDIIVLTVCRYVAEKGYLDLAQAIERLTPLPERLRFLWVAPVLPGEGDALGPDVLESPRLRTVVTRLGRRHDLARIYRCADLLLHPSHREGVPRALIEAAACGLPVVASDIPGNREVVTFGLTATGFPAGSPFELAKVLEGVLGNLDALRPLAGRAKAEVRGRMSVEAVAGRVQGVYRELGLGVSEPAYDGA